MADPVSALAAVGVAASFIQVIDFSVKVLHNAGKLMNENAQDKGDIGLLTGLGEQYAHLSQLLQKSQTRPLSEGDMSMNTLATKCQDVSGELLDMLAELKIGDTTSSVKKAAKAIKVAGKAALKKNEIQLKQDRLKQLNGLLGTAILSSLRQTQIEFQEDLLEKMSQDTRTVLEAVRVASSTVTGEANRQIAKAARIANSLKFPEMLRRKDAVPDSYESTYEWAFESQRTPFAEWLENGNGIFWISGKAGSGKSTLMKFLTDHDKTKTLCSRWAGAECHLVRSDFYFWYGGSSMQKSVAGLLQSLLYHIFKGCPDLVRRVCLERWKCEDNDVMETYPWSEDELEATLRLAAAEDCRAWIGDGESRKEVPVQYMFFIDGLDEYAGNHRELAELVISLAENTHIKMCISSRPWTPFCNVFEETNRFLRLEEYTADDIATYVRGQLNQAEKKNRHHRRSLSTSQSATDSLVQSIIDKAQGVFFWVFLVVRSLSDGFANGDSVSLLHKRVLDLPGELREYFALILRRLDGTYKRLTAPIFYLMSLLSKPNKFGLHAISFIDLWRLDEKPDYFESEDFHLEAPEALFNSDELRDLLLCVTRMIRAWCRDFLFVPAAQAISQSDSDLDLIKAGRIEYLHRTVHDFFITDEMQNIIKADVPNHFGRPDLTQRLIWARLRSVSISIPHEACEFYHTAASIILVWAVINRADSKRDGTFRLVDDYGAHYFTSHCHRQICPRSAYQMVALILASEDHYTLASAIVPYYDAEFGDSMLLTYTDFLYRLKTDVPTHLHPSKSELAFFRILLEAGANVDKKLHRDTRRAGQNCTVWTRFILDLMEIKRHGTLNDDTWELIKLFLEYGADPEIKLPSEAAGPQPMTLKEALRSIVPEELISEVDPLIKHYSSLTARVEALERRERLRMRDGHSGQVNGQLVGDEKDLWFDAIRDLQWATNHRIPEE